MTTILYSHKEKLIAYDSRITCGNKISSDCIEKSKRVKDVTFFFTGCPADDEKIIESYFSDGRDIDSRAGVSGFAIDHKERKVFLLSRDNCELVVDSIECSDSLGSGGEFALASLDHGKTARQAVKYAMTRDCRSGGKVRVVKV
ncbi:MAG: hypothetical protein GY799_24805 [Desulfobulbaceae bacterium]|nr:hypothetical protein [Desulfobulbaceae bacterium]MCP4831214.1 hypothetical protein [Gammaproteobacteria bacterium]